MAEHVVRYRKSGRWLRLMWDDELGLVEGNTTDAVNLQQAMLNAPIEWRLSPLGSVMLENPSTDKADFLGLFEAIVGLSVSSGVVDLPASLEGVDPTRPEPSPLARPFDKV